ncbi:phosphoglycerate dehydrogenase [Coxiella endosymbiont of Ornithodoros maritimus]|uniref:phosphoglycerate dehydrogenase n=1 Tax=Coxiella endosymbiont of Ornithodoros maritimus TaxID=1656172 RepID=UPI002264F1CF|nr:phosphoglycerate dehydrogenase [Coxiella endosymbiont of Ornithodoros maritimus]
MNYKILLLDNISPHGLEKFNPEKYTLLTECEEPDAILVRSCNLHDKKIADRVQVIGRAGVGVNNIPVRPLTLSGVPVLNTPGANANAVKELVITGILLASRHIYPALDYARHIEGDDETITQQVEKNKKRFSGFELPGKTLGIIGLGQVGVKVANAAVRLGMKAIGYDPAITVRSAWELSSEVAQAESLRYVLRNSDFVTVHVPLNTHTHHLINEEAIAQMKNNVVLLNFARAEIVDNQALAQALSKNKIQNYVCDFPSRIFKSFPQVICLPHLGASTKEAEENCAIMVVEQIQDFLENGYIRNSINFPTVKLVRTEGCRIAITNKNVPNMVAQVSTVLSQADINIIDMINKSRDEIAYTIIDVNKKIDQNILHQLQSIDGIIRVRLL